MTLKRNNPITVIKKSNWAILLVSEFHVIFKKLNINT